MTANPGVTKFKGIPPRLVLEYCRPLRPANVDHDAPPRFNPAHVQRVFGQDYSGKGNPRAMKALAFHYAVRRAARKAGPQFFSGAAVVWGSKTNKKGIIQHPVYLRKRGAMIDVLTPAGELVTKREGLYFGILDGGTPVTEQKWRERCAEAGVAT